MAVYGQYDWRRPRNRISVSSLALLAVFIAAAAFMAAIVVWRPGIGGGGGGFPSGLEAAGQQPAGEAAAEAALADGAVAAPAGEAGAQPGDGAGQ